MHPSTQRRDLRKSVTYIKCVIIQRKECKSQSPSHSGPSGCVNSPVLTYAASECKSCFNNKKYIHCSSLIQGVRTVKQEGSNDSGWNSPLPSKITDNMSEMSATI